VPAVFDRYSKLVPEDLLPDPAGREDELARKGADHASPVGQLVGIQLKEKHCKFPQALLGSWVDGSPTSARWHPPVLEGWEPPTLTSTIRQNSQRGTMG